LREGGDEVKTTPDLKGTSGVMVFVFDVSPKPGDFGKGLIVDKEGGLQISIDHYTSPNDLLEGDFLRQDTPPR